MATRTATPKTTEPPTEDSLTKLEERLGRVERAIGAMATQLHGLGGSGRVAKKDMDLATLMLAYERQHADRSPVVTLGANLAEFPGGAR